MITVLWVPFLVTISTSMSRTLFSCSTRLPSSSSTDRSFAPSVWVTSSVTWAPAGTA